MPKKDAKTVFHENFEAAHAASPDSLADLAVKSGISEQTLRNLLRETTRTPQKRTVHSLETAMGLPPGSLLKKRGETLVVESDVKIGPILQSFEARLSAMERRIEALERAAIANLR